MKFLFFATLLVLAAADNDVETKYEAVESQDTRQVFYQPQPYSFTYSVLDEESNNDYLHSENTDGKVTTGSYRVSLPDGRTRFVTYKADENGYVANVVYEGEAHHPDRYIAPPFPSFQTPAAVPYLAAASSTDTIHEALAVKENAVPAAKESVTSTTKTRDEPENKETTALATKTRNARSVKELTSQSVEEATTPTHNPSSPPSYQTAAPLSKQTAAPPAYNPPSLAVYSPPSPPAYQPSAHKTSGYRYPSAYRSSSAPGYKPAPSSHGFTPIGPAPLAYRG